MLVFYLYQQRYNSSFLMLKFRSLKDKIITSKRNSQKLSQEELLHFLHEQASVSRLKYSRAARLQAEINQITEEDYKIIQKDKSSLSNEKHSASRLRREEVISKLQYLRTQANLTEQTQFHVLDYQPTAKKGTNLSKSVIQGSNFTKIIDLMRQVNDLQQKKSENPSRSQQIREQIRRKLAEVKFLICTIEDQSQKSLIDFYNEDYCIGSSSGQANDSPDSFNSQNSDETYRMQSEREAYEFSASKDREDTNQSEEGKFQIKYRRVSPDCYEKESIYETLEDEEDLSPECCKYEDKSQEKSIIHLFSYEKEQCLNSPLSRITERESEYCSPSSKQSRLTDSLQYKKIFYLLQTSEKKEQTTYRKEVSQFTPSNHSIAKSITSIEEKDRSRCHEQLGEMINLLQSKYQRKIKIGVENLMDSLNIAIKSKSIRLRPKK